MMKYATFRKMTRISMKAFAVAMIILLLVSAVVGVAYLRGGIRGIIRLPLISSLVGIDRQVDLGAVPVTGEEIEDLHKLLGTEIKNVRPGVETSSGTLALSAGQFSYLLDQGGLEDEMFSNVQVALEQRDGQAVLSISSMADAASVAVAAGFSQADLDAVVGQLPDEVAILAEVVLPDSGDPDAPLQLVALNIGRIELSDTLMDSANRYLESTLASFFKNQYGIGMTGISGDGRSILIAGDVPLAGSGLN